MSLSDYQKRRELNNKKIIERIIMSRNYHKFDGLKQYYDEIERKFEIDKKELSKRYDEEIDENEINPYIKNEVDDYFSEKYYWIEDVFLKRFRYSIVVTIYSLLEFSLNRLCRYLFKSIKLGLKLEDVRGDGIERAKLYLSKVCLIDFPEQSNEWNMMQKLNSIRNCVVHAEGIVPNVKSPKKLKNIINNTDGLELENEKYLKIEGSYIASAIVHAKKLIDKVHEKAFAKI